MSNIPPRPLHAETCEFPGCFNQATHAMLCRNHFRFIPANISQPLLAAFKADNLAEYNKQIETTRTFLKSLRGTS